MKYKIKGKMLVCAHCGSREFKTKAVQLNTTMMTLFGLDWLNRNATTYICVECGKIEWFLPSEEGDDEASPETKCLSCGAVIPPEDGECPVCGWTYNKAY